MSWSISQRHLLANFYSNLAVAWFSAGVISPIFIKPPDPLQLITAFTWGIATSYGSLQLALKLIRQP